VRRVGIVVIAFVGTSRSRIGEIVLIVEGKNTSRIQEVHIVDGYVMCKIFGGIVSLQ
jgi:phosphoheptose isomerase